MTSKNSSTFICKKVDPPPEPQSLLDSKFFEHQKQLTLQDIVNQARLSKIQRNYIKCSKGKCPAEVSVHARRINKFRKKRKVNYLSTVKHDRKLSRIFVDKGRKKRIEILQAEVSELDLRLKVATGKLHMKETEEHYRKIEENLRQQEDMVEKIKKAKMEVGHIKSQLERVDRKSVELDHETEAEVPFREHLARANRQLEIHENRLQISLQREGKTTAENKQLRELLCKMLYSRSIFNKHWSQIVENLKNRKKFLLDMIERSSTAFSQDADLMDNYKRLQTRRNQDRETAIAEMLKMKRQIDANDIMDVFLGQKGKTRPFVPLERREVERRKAFKETYDNRYNFYQSILDEMKKYPDPSASNPVSKTREHFTKINNDLFGYYRFRDDMGRRLDSILEMVNGATRNFNKDYSKAERIRLYYEERFKEREQTLRAEIDNTMKYKMEHDNLKRQIQSYSNAFFRIMKTLRCDMSAVDKLLRKSDVLNEHNLEIYLSILEQRMNEVIAFLYCKERGLANIQVENPKLTVKSLKHEDARVPKLSDIIKTQQCPECAQTEDVNLFDAGGKVSMLNDEEIRQVMINKTNKPGLAYRMHTLSACNLPRSGIIASRRYAE